jgi:hypothetical protein
MIDRRMALRGAAAALLAAGWPENRSLAMQPEFTWRRIPAITVLGAAADPRVQLVREAVAFWNERLAEVDSPFQLGVVGVEPGRLPDYLIVVLSKLVVSSRIPIPLPPPELATPLLAVPGDLVVALTEADFVSTAYHWPEKGFVAIGNPRVPPLSLPNVARNVIAAEMGHAIGLGDNGEPTALMCGRKPPCTPAAFQSARGHYFRVTDVDQRALIWLYPRNWRPG